MKSRSTSPTVGHKHTNKTSITYAWLIGLVTAIFALWPMSAQAMDLPASLNPFNLFSAEELPAPDYSDRMGGVLVADVAIEVEEANWPARGSTSLAVNDIPREAIKVYPKADQPLVLEGEASFYSRAGCLGCSPSLTMANGQTLDDDALTMAIGADKKHLVGYTAVVTSLATGQSVEVRITDTGGFYADKYGNRVADLTIATKQAIGMVGGVGQVRVEVY